MSDKKDAVPAGTPWGVEGHRPIVPMAAGAPPWCECGYRQDLRDPDSPILGEHIRRVAAERGVPVGTHAGWLQ